MSLHSSKRLALLQLTNCMPSCNVKTIRQLGDGKIFLSMIETAFPEKTFNLQSEGKQIFNDEHSNCENKAMDPDSNMPDNDSKELDFVVESKEVTESAINQSIATLSDQSSEFFDVISVAESLKQISIDGTNAISSVDKKLPHPVQTIEKKDEDLSKRYNLIQCFIDEQYGLQSGHIISYKECMTANEFELAKLILFVVSEVIRLYVQINNAVIHTLSHLDLRVQQDLEACFNLFINERTKISETSINKLLSSPAIYKVSPSKSSFVTPKRSCTSKYKRSTSPSASPLQDSVFIDSPLKTYFESPIFTKKDIITKEKEILKTRENLYEEEMKSSTLQLTVKELKNKIKNKDKEIQKLKTRIKELEETEKVEDCENCAILGNSLKEKEKQFRAIKSQNEERYESLKNEYEEKLIGYKIEVSENLSSCKYEAAQAERHCNDLETELDDLKFELLKKEQDINYYVEKLDHKTRECEISKEKLTAALKELKRTHEYSIAGETIGGVIEKENEDLRRRIDQLELIVRSKQETMVDAMVNCTEDSFDRKAVENSTVSKNELPPTQNIFEKTESVIFSDNLNNNNLNPIPSDSVGVLWQQYNDSMTENESTNDGNFFEKSVNKVLNSLQKVETEFLKQNNKRIKLTSRANGSNGLVSPPVLKELKDELKSLKRSVLCLSRDVAKSDVKFQNDNLISNTNEVINGKDSTLPVNFTCDTCLRNKELQINVNSVSQDSAALVEKTKELEEKTKELVEKTKELVEKTKEFDILKDKHLNALSTLHFLENEFLACKKKYIFMKRENLQNVKVLKDLEIKHNKLQSQFKDLKKTENEYRKCMKKKLETLTIQLREKNEIHNRNVEKCNSHKTEIERLKASCRTFQNDRAQIKSLMSHIEALENEVKNLRFSKSHPEQSTSTKQETRTRSEIHSEEVQFPSEHFVLMIPKTEPLSPNESEASSLNVDTEGNITASALYKKNLQNPFQLHTADEESFLNHSSIAGLSRNNESEDSLTRMQEWNRRNTLCMPQFNEYHDHNHEQLGSNRVGELSRRNTLCMPHLQSCYPAEGAPINSPYNLHLSSNYVHCEIPEGAKKSSERGNNEPAGKKRKVSEMRDDQSSDVVNTPFTKARNMWRTPRSIHKLLKMSGPKNRRKEAIKPKPE